MATAISPHVDEVEQTLIVLDAQYARVYGPDLASWSKGVRGEYFETLRSHRTADREFHPVHPRKASAARRRRHLRQLPWKIRQIAPGADSVLLTPVWTDASGTAERVYVVTARSATAKQHLKLPVGGSRQLTALIQRAFPKADWEKPQTWHADLNQLTVWGQASRAFRETADAGYVEDLAAYSKRTGGQHGHQKGDQ
ncbi:hypothetical protein [Streptomyces sp. KL116D]|uniref:hypothetical protein n=1 Tax=Streptomyces sp. KL116D TaxID=3045152 RepID=UPI00355626AE